MLLELKKETIYGPVMSRRLGSSLGINLFPGDRKFCSFDCLYCQYGFSDPNTTSPIDNPGFAADCDILEAIGQAMKTSFPSPAYLTFSGNGEATLHPQFGKLVEGLKALRDQYTPKAKTAILSNSSMVSVPHIRKALQNLDVRIMKLDAGQDRTFHEYNRPAERIDLDQITTGLVALEGVTIQSLFTSGMKGNYTEENVDEWIGRIRLIAPVDVQLYTLDRQSPTGAISPLDLDGLRSIRSRLKAVGISASVF